MNPTAVLSSLQNSNALLAILWAGLTCGTLDITAALVVYSYFGRPPRRELEAILLPMLDQYEVVLVEDSEARIRW